MPTQTKKTAVEIASNDALLGLGRLEGVYERAMTASSRKSFFLAVYEYIHMLDNDPVLERVSLSIKESEKSDTGHMEALGEKIIQESQAVEKEIREYMDANAVTNPKALQELKDYDMYKNGNLVRHGSPPPQTHYDFMTYTLVCLVEDETANHISFARQFGDISDEGRVQEWTFSPGYKEWEQQKRYWERMRLTKTWYALKQLVTFYLVYRDYEKMKRESIEKDEMLRVLDLTLLHADIMAILEEKNGPSEQTREFQHEEYKGYLQGVHGFIKGELLRASSSLEPSGWSFDPSSGVLSVNGQDIKFKPSGFRAQILKLLSSSEEAKRKTWEWDEIHESVEGIGEARKSAKGKVYDANKGIVEQVTAQSSGAIVDFLIFDTRTVHINPRYL